ncbi:MAG TPA: hypothetical protein VNH20_09430 [Candidatus Dormibacteraeota bacterium]|nr:hypothetical protein [Candidatus Dormibacteraeota bacterium]
MIEPEVSEREQAVTRVGPNGADERTITRTTTTVAPMGFRIKSAVWLVAGVVDAILALDFIFKLAASGDVGFVSFISGLAGALSAPFRGVFTSSVSTGHYAYWADIAGMVVYLLLAGIAVALLGIMTARRPPRSDGTGVSA